METWGSGPVVQCKRLQAEMAGGSWKALEAAFQSAEAIPLRQSWRDAPEAGFRPATVKTLWMPDALLVYAVIEDADIFNPVEAFNEPAFTKGDVFELFLRAGGQDPYYEFHVSPRNQLLQLRIPSASAFSTPKSEPGIPREWFIHDWRIVSRVDRDPVRECWRVLAEIPTGRIGGGRPAQAGDQWGFSFSRYDYTRGVEQPVLSSSSPHTVLNFHRQNEWGCLCFV